jgi:hypothetical protein
VLDQPSSTPTAAPPAPTSVFTSPARPMTQVAHGVMTANVSLTPVAWGTRLDLTCRYPHGTVGYETGSFALVVHTTDGRTQRVATWNGLPGQSMKVSGATAALASDITSVVVTRMDGSPVLHLHT